MRILIVGGGLAGLTLAAKLRQQGREPVIVERRADYGETGYSISLYPMGSAVLHGLGVYPDYHEQAVELRNYNIHDLSGTLLRDIDLGAVTGQTDPVRMLRHTELLRLLLAAAEDVPIHFDVTVSALTQYDERVAVRYSGTGTPPETREFDLVVGCDGIRSTVRDQFVAPASVFDARWMLWTWRLPAGLLPPGSVHEYWGSEAFLGLYPVRGNCMVGAGLPAAVARDAARAHVELREKLPAIGGEGAAVADALPPGDELFQWPMADARARRWTCHRVALCGDAAAAFLPTAGIGASAAMRAAAALADELSKADAAWVPHALDLYTARARTIIEELQQDSRRLAKYMFLRSPLLCRLRNAAVRLLPARGAVKHIARSMRQPF